MTLFFEIPLELSRNRVNTEHTDMVRPYEHKVMGLITREMSTYALHLTVFIVR